MAAGSYGTAAQAHTTAAAAQPAHAAAPAVPSPTQLQPPTAVADRNKPPEDSSAAAPDAAEPTHSQPADVTSSAAASSPSSQPPIAARAVPHQASPMLRCLTKCRDVQFALMRMLRLKDLAALNGTCRKWREWLRNPPLIKGLKYDYEGTLLQLDPLMASDWARQLVTSVEVRREGGPDNWTLLPGEAGDSAERTACSLLLIELPRFTRLHTLSLSVCAAFADSQGWSACFAALSGGLWRLDMAVDKPGRAKEINGALAHVNLLGRLQKVRVSVASASDARELDLSQMPLLPLLNTFQLHAKNENGNLLPFRCTPTQTQSLAQCRQLTYLNSSGIWSPDEREADDEGWQLPSPEQQIADGIATLVRGLTSADESAPVSSSSSAVTAHAAAPAPCVLRYLNLCQTLMSAAVWEHASQLNSLVDLQPATWRSDITPQQWARLADFTQVRTIIIVAHPDDEYVHADRPLRTDHFLPSLLQCAQLRYVALSGSTLSLSVAQLDGVARLTRMETLGLDSVELESVAPLAAAHKLHTLILSVCRGPPAVVDFRRSLPLLPSLTSLRLQDRCRLTAAQAAPLNTTLLARMPKLSAERFTQNLLD